MRPQSNNNYTIVSTTTKSQYNKSCFFFLLGSLTAVITNLKPFVSVPHPSVTYFSVTKFVRVKSAPTDCFVFLQDISD